MTKIKVKSSSASPHQEGCSWAFYFSIAANTVLKKAVTSPLEDSLNQFFVKCGRHKSVRFLIIHFRNISRGGLLAAVWAEYRFMIPDTANKIGYELAMSFTKGKHAFVVCTHIDKAHIHNHIIFNSTTLDCERKFKNFLFSNRAIRRISDLLCVENGLSVIKNPKPSKGSYADWLGDKKEPTNQEILKQKIDEILPLCATFEDFIARLKADGYMVNEKRKHLSVQAPGWGKASRLNTLGGNYTEAALRLRLGMAKTVTGGGGGQLEAAPGNRSEIAGIKPNLLVDIQAKLKQGKGAGYAHWAKIHNLKEAAKTLLFLKENGIDSYEDLKEKSTVASSDFTARLDRIRKIEARQKEIAALQKQIGTYGKTKDIYAKYKASGWSRGFYDIHSADIILHRAAKKYFDSQDKEKLPSIGQLRKEYGTLAAELKTLYRDYHNLKKTSRELVTACANVEQILNIAPDEKTKDRNHRDRR